MITPRFEVKSGASRTVLLIHSYAFKLPRIGGGWRAFLLGLLSNLRERELGRKREEHLCPVKFSVPGGWLVVMPRVKPLGEMDYDTLANITAGPLRTASSWDFKPCSFGWLNGRIVAVDYHGNI